MTQSGIKSWQQRDVLPLGITSRVAFPHVTPVLKVKMFRKSPTLQAGLCLHKLKLCLLHNRFPCCFVVCDESKERTIPLLQIVVPQETKYELSLLWWTESLKKKPSCTQKETSIVNCSELSRFGEKKKLIRGCVIFNLRCQYFTHSSVQQFRCLVDCLPTISQCSAHVLVSCRKCHNKSTALAVDTYLRTISKHAVHIFR